MQTVMEDKRSLWRRSHSLAEFEETMSTLLRPCRAEERRGARYRTEILHERIGGLGMTVVSTGSPARIKVAPDRRLSLLQIPLAGAFISHAGRRESAAYEYASDAQLVDAQSALDLEFQDATRMLIIDLTPEQIDAVGGFSTVRACGGERRISLRTAEGGRLLRLARFVLNEMENAPLDGAAADIARGLEQSMIATIGAALDAAQRSARSIGDTPCTLRAHPENDPRALRQAERFMREHVAEALTPADIAGAAGLSPRSLHRLFRRHRDTTPLAALKDMRLERVHAELLSGRCPPNGLTALAMEWGFNHSGLFAADYRRKFGAAPSETLRAHSRRYS